MTLKGESMPTRSTKDLMREAVEQLPPDATVEDAMERLYLLAKIERGVEQADAGKTLDHDEVRQRLGT
jgi:predicted transcriptional regulator